MPIKGGQRFGINLGPAEQANNLRDVVESLCDMLFTAEPAVVESFDFKTQRATVRLKNYPDVLSFRNIPIAGTGGSLRRVMKLATDDVGVLLFMRSDSRRSFDDNTVQDPTTSHCHGGLGAIFIPGPMLSSNTLPANASESALQTNPDAFGPNDDTLAHESGSFITFKGNGDIVIVANKTLYLGGQGATPSTFHNAAYDGGDVTPATTKVKVSN